MKKLLSILIIALFCTACTREEFSTLEIVYHNGDTITLLPNYDNGNIISTEYYFDGELIGETTEMPFVYEYTLHAVSAGQHQIDTKTYTEKLVHISVRTINVEL